MKKTFSNIKDNCNFYINYIIHINHVKFKLVSISKICTYFAFNKIIFEYFYLLIFQNKI